MTSLVKTAIDAGLFEADQGALVEGGGRTVVLDAGITWLEIHLAEYSRTGGANGSAKLRLGMRDPGGAARRNLDNVAIQAFATIHERLLRLAAGAHA